MSRHKWVRSGRKADVIKVQGPAPSMKVVGVYTHWRCVKCKAMIFNMGRPAPETLVDNIMPGLQFNCDEVTVVKIMES